MRGLSSLGFRSGRGVVACTCNLSTRKVEAEGPQIGSQPKLHRPASAMCLQQDTLAMKRQAVKVKMANGKELRFLQH